MAHLELIVIVGVHALAPGRSNATTQGYELSPLSEAAIVPALCVGGGEIPQPVHFHQWAFLLAVNQRVRARRQVGRGSAGGKAPVEGGEELAWLLVGAPGSSINNL